MSLHSGPGPPSAMETMLVSSLYTPCFQRYEHTAVNHLQVCLALFSIFLALYAASDTSHSEHPLPPRKRTLAPKLKDANNAAEPEIRMHQQIPRSQSAAPGNSSSHPSHNDTPETSSNVNASEQEPGSNTVLGALYTLTS